MAVLYSEMESTVGEEPFAPEDAAGKAAWVGMPYIGLPCTTLSLFVCKRFSRVAG